MNEELPVAEGEDQEWDDTPTALFLRALFTLIAGGYLSWAQWNSGILDPGAQWGRWVGLSVVANLLIPLGIVTLFFAQDIRHVAYLKNQALNAWNYGFNFSEFKTHIKWAGAMTAIMLPFIFFASRSLEARAAYAGYIANLHNGPAAVVTFFGLLVVYMFCWEWFHRGFLLFGIAQSLGAIPAIIIQAGLFGLAHAGKPLPEQYGAYAGGLILGTIAWRQKSFATAFYTHAMVHIAWILMLLI